MADRFWVGGTGTWDTTNTANWSATSGGASGASVPVAVDIAIIDANSGGGTITLAQDTTLQILRTAGFTGTLDFSTFKFTLTASGTTIFTGSTTATYAGRKLIELSYAGAVGTRTVGTVGFTEANAIDFTFTAGGDVAGTLSLGVVRNLTYGPAFTGSMASTAATIFGDLTLNSGMTVAASGNMLTFGSTSGTERAITSAGRTIDRPITFNGVGGTWRCADALTQGSTRSVTLTSGNLLLKEGVTSTFGGMSAGAGTQRVLASGVPGTAATLSIAAGTATMNNTTITDITATGGAVFSAFVTNGNINNGGNSGWDFNAQLGLYIFSRRKNRRVMPA